MDALILVIQILLVLCGLAIILIVLFQSGKSAGLSGAIGLLPGQEQGPDSGRQAGPCYQMGGRRFPGADPDPADLNVRPAKKNALRGVLFLCATSEAIQYSRFWRYTVKSQQLLNCNQLIPLLPQQVGQAQRRLHRGAIDVMK